MKIWGIFQQIPIYGLLNLNGIMQEGGLLQVQKKRFLLTDPLFGKVIM